MEVVIATILCIFALTAVLLSCYALHQVFETKLEMRALKNSTHQVQFVPVDDTSPDDDEDVAMSRALAKSQRKALEDLTLGDDEPLS